MAKCVLCGKKPVFGHNVPKSHKKTRRTWQPNIHKMRVIIDGRPQRVNVCAQCLKSGRAVKAI